jgi:hypothetical protein
VLAFTNGGGAWSSALLFAGWLEAAGVMAMAISGAYLADSRRPPVVLGGAVGPGTAGLQLSAGF